MESFPHPPAELLVERSPTAVLYVTADGDLLYANPAAVQLFGYTAAEFRALKLEDLVPDDVRPHHGALVGKFWSNPTARPMGSIDLEIRARRKDGTEMPADIGLIPVSGEMVVCIVRDMSPYVLFKKTQEELIRTSRLRSIGVMAAGVAHEINNPMAFIRTNLETLRRQTEELESLVGAARALRRQAGADSAEAAAWDTLELRLDIDEEQRDAREALDEALHGALTVGQIVQGLSAFARQDSVAPDATADLRPVLERSVRMAQHRVGHACHIQLPEPLDVQVVGDSIRLQQVVLNLVVNAVQAVGESGTVTVLSRIEGTEAVVSVEDNGPGIPQETMQKIFDPFFTTKEVGSGTGLGLHICHQIVTDVGGRIEVESTLGSGTTFRVHIPLGTSPVT